MKIFCSLLLIAAISGISLDASESKRRVREFRPMEVRTKSIVTAANASQVSSKLVARPINPSTDQKEVADTPANPEADSKRATGLGWQYYDRQMWEPSKEWFLTALGWDSSNRKAAEGLLMTMYHGESARAAYDLGVEFSSAMPGINEMVTGAVSDEAERLIAAGDPAKADALLNQFPGTEKDFVEVRRKLKSESVSVGEVPATRAAAKQQAAEKELPSAVEFIKQVRASDEEIGKKRGMPKSNRKKILYAAAKQAHLEERYRSSLWYLDEAGKLGALGSDESNLKAWNLYSTGRHEEALVLFEELYRQDSDDLASAHGLYLTLGDLNAHDYCGEISTELGGALSGFPMVEPTELASSATGCRLSDRQTGEVGHHFAFAGLTGVRSHFR